jgi:hypothetical protein
MEDYDTINKERDKGQILKTFFCHIYPLSVVKTCGEASVDEEKFYRNCNKQVVHTVNSATIFSFPFQKWKY